MYSPGKDIAPFQLPVQSTGLFVFDPGQQLVIADGRDIISTARSPHGPGSPAEFAGEIDPPLAVLIVGVTVRSPRLGEHNVVFHIVIGGVNKARSRECDDVLSPEVHEPASQLEFGRPAVEHEPSSDHAKRILSRLEIAIHAGDQSRLHRPAVVQRQVDRRVEREVIQRRWQVCRRRSTERVQSNSGGDKQEWPSRELESSLQIQAGDP